MKHLVIISILGLLVLIFSFNLFSSRPNAVVVAQKESKFILGEIALPDVSARSFLVFDVATGEYLYESNSDAVLPLASVTKLWSSYVFYQSADLLSTTTIVFSDLSAPGESAKFSAGEVRTMHELMFAALLTSSNDAAYAMERLDTDLIEKMNLVLESETLNFVDAAGISPKNVGTVKDVALIYDYILSNNSHVLDITSLGAYYAQKGGWLNNNPFIYDNSYRGGKHGYLPESGRTTIAIFEEGLANGVKRNIGYVLLGSSNLEEDIRSLRGHIQTRVSFE